MYGADAALSVTRKRESSTPQRRRGVKGSSAFERVKKFQPHPEERPKGASRRMAASHCRASILRDAVLRTAPQDEVVDFFTPSSKVHCAPPPAFRRIA